MMNVNDSDVNLKLALGSKNYSIRTRLINRSPGAGVNANSRMDMAFAASDPLSELVWSPHNGLSLRCAHSSLADKKPFPLWNVEPNSSKDFSPSQSIRSKESEDEVFDDKANMVRPSRSFSTLEFGAGCGGFDGSSNGIIEEKASKDAIQEEENCTDDAEENFPQNVQIADIAEISKEKTGPNTSADGIYDCKVNTVDLDVVNNSDAEQVNKNNINIPFSIPAPALNKLEYSAENDLCNPTAKDNNSPPVENSPTNSKICLYLENGNEKALSEGDICGRSSDHDKENSYGSVESCNSTGLFLKGVKRQSYDQELMLGSKRMKNSTSIIGPDNSFMCWIANMAKGLSDSNNYKDDSSSLALALACSHNVCGKNQQENIMCNKAHDSASLSMGFETVFGPLYCRHTNISNTGAEKENDSKEESTELMVAEKTSVEDNSCKQIVVANKEVHPINVGSQYAFESDLMQSKVPETEKTTPKMPVNDVPEKSNPITSLWIARFSTKAPKPEKCEESNQEIVKFSTCCPTKAYLDNRVTDAFPIDQKSYEAKDGSENEMQRITAHAESSVDLKSTSKLCPIQPSQKLRSSEAMASVFARRLDALKHIIPSRKINSSTCFFCGSSHDLRECPDVTEDELEDLLLNLSSFARVEESPYLCIRCFKLDHWAVSCPFGQWRSEQNASDISHYTSCHLQLSAGNEKTNGVNDVEGSKSFPLCNILTGQDAVAPMEIFHAIRNLRLSRADILRWMNSNVSLSHLNGFFLRLRLGKLEPGLGETSYYVACITGDTGERNGYESKKSILVDVGGIKLSVGSQYVSNHDFMEDEIKAWWCRVVNNGCKIPSIDELNSKFNDRKSLGF